MVAADAERHALGGAAGKFRMQQRVELIAVAGGERGVERAGEIGRAAAFHPKTPFSNPLFSTVFQPAERVEAENPLEAAKRRCYYSNGQSDYF